MKDTIEVMLAGREKRYGSFAGHSKIAQDLKKVMVETGSWHDLSNDKKEALEMIQHKVARILNGDPEYDDNWRDIAGYATLVEKDLAEKARPVYGEAAKGASNYGECLTATMRDKR